MSTEWAIPTVERERSRKALDKISKSIDGEQVQDKRILYCTNCKHCFQKNTFSAKRFYKGNEIEVYVDFPSIGKERVESCAKCK